MITKMSIKSGGVFFIKYLLSNFLLLYILDKILKPSGTGGITSAAFGDCTRTIGLWPVKPLGFGTAHRTSTGPSDF